MASMGNVIPVLRSVGPWKFCMRIWQQVSEDGVLVWASALAYSWLFAIFPFLIVLLSLVAYLPERGRNSAEKTVTGFVAATLGKAAPTINENVSRVMNDRHKSLLGFGLLVSLWVASGGMSMTMSALDQCYDLKEVRPWYRVRPVAIVMTVIVAACVMAVFVLLPVGSGLERWLRARNYLSGSLALTFNIVRYGLAMLLLIIVLTLIYHFGPNIRQRLVIFSPGAVFCIIVWGLLDVGFRFYIDHYARYDQTYGTVGGAAILLFFFYIDALVLLVGAEINSEIDFAYLGVEPGSKDFLNVPKRPHVAAG
jgi:membrane protein